MPSYSKRKTRRDALDKCKDSYRKWRKKLVSYLGKHKLNRKQRRRMEALFGIRGYQGPIRASDILASRRLCREYVRVIDAFQRTVPTARWFHVTLLADEAVLSERKPCLALKRIRGKAYKAIQGLGLHGIVFIDKNPLPNHPQKGEGGSFLFHVHALCYTQRPFELREARRTLADSRSWSCALGAPPTNIREITRPMGRACWWAAYDAKAPYEAKNRRVTPGGNVKLLSTERGYRNHVAMRLAEGLSQIALRDTFFSVGEAKDLREDIWRRVMKWHRRRWSDQKPTRSFDEARLWKRFWATSRARFYRAWFIIGSTL